MTRWSRETATVPWPADVKVQGSDYGIVISRTAPTRETAFVEAFPATGGFIRGEGETLAEAEAEAWSKYIAEMKCEMGDGHDFERRGYTNGAGFCKRCNGFRSGVFDELPPDPNRQPSLLEELIDKLKEGGEN